MSFKDAMNGYLQEILSLETNVIDHNNKIVWNDQVLTPADPYTFSIVVRNKGTEAFVSDVEIRVQPEPSGPVILCDERRTPLRPQWFGQKALPVASGNAPPSSNPGDADTYWKWVSPILFPVQEGASKGHVTNPVSVRFTVKHDVKCGPGLFIVGVYATIIPQANFWKHL